MKARKDEETNKAFLVRSIATTLLLQHDNMRTALFIGAIVALAGAPCLTRSGCAQGALNPPSARATGNLIIRNRAGANGNPLSTGKNYVFDVGGKIFGNINNHGFSRLTHQN